MTTRYKLGITAALLVASVLIGLAVWRTDTGEPGDDITVSGQVVEATTPRDDAEALRQTQITIDLAAGYDGRLVIDSVEIPDEQLERETNLNQVSFTPGEGKAIEQLEAGPTCVLAVYWKLSEGEGGPGTDTYRWCFDVT